MNDSLGDRMKRYESVPQNHLSIRTPVIIRLDGKSFHTFTKRFDSPFDKTLAGAMISSAFDTAKKMQGFKLGFTASDEVSLLLTDFDRLETCAWFDYNVQKIVSIAASYMTVYFNEYMQLKFSEKVVFDARAFNVPESEISNYFLWRQKDWARNSVSAYASMFFSHNLLEGAPTAKRHEMLYTIGKNWSTDVDAMFKNGTYFTALGKTVNILPSFATVNELVTAVLPKSDDSTNPLKISYDENCTLQH